MSKILRYGTEEERSVIYTPLDPLEDLSNQLAGLRSEEYVRSVLVEKHSIPEDEVAEVTLLVGHHAINAVGFLQQAYAGPPELCFLPIYYAVLSLSKIYVLCGFGVEELRKNSHHGAHFSMEQPSDPLDHVIEMRSDFGVFQSFFRVLTNQKPEWEKIDVATLLLLVPSTEFELERVLGKSPALCDLGIHIEEPDAGTFRLKVEIYMRHGTPSPPSELEVLKSCKLTWEDSTPSRDTYVGEVAEGANLHDVTPRLLQGIRRELLYFRPAPFFANIITSTPARVDFAVPEDIPLWLLFFWLSNLVRYSPEVLSSLQATKLWPILLTLRKHAVLRFLVLFWSFFHQTTFGIKPGTM